MLLGDGSFLVFHAKGLVLGNLGRRRPLALRIFFLLRRHLGRLSRDSRELCLGVDLSTNFLSCQTQTTEFYLPRIEKLSFQLGDNPLSCKLCRLQAVGGLQ